MKKIVHAAWMVSVAVAAAGCTSATATSAGVSAHASVAAAPSSAATASPLGMLPIPAGATAWTTNTNAPMSLVAYIDKFYIASSWVQEKSQYARRGFVTGGYEGWINAGGSQQRIAIARFATANGAISAYDDLSSAFAEKAAPATTFADPAVSGVGSVEPKLDSDGNALVDIVARVGDLLVDVHELTAATPDPAAAKALILSQVKALKSGS